MWGGNSSGFMISPQRRYPAEIAKARFPLRYGTYAEVKTADYEFLFNLNGEIKLIRGLGSDWPHPAEQLKRTDGNDWVYYTVGDESGENGIRSWLGEYYLPCLPYPSNPVWEVDHLTNPAVMGALGAWSQLYANLYGARQQQPHGAGRGLMDRILASDDQRLHERSQRLQAITGGRVSVLPPDTRHVDYQVVPLTIADGCLYHCRFCCIKSEHGFRPRPEDDISRQIRQLKSHYGPDLENYGALFLGHHDALAAGGDRVAAAASEADEAFGFSARTVRPSLFLFGSADSLLKASHATLEALDRLPYDTYLNIGLESVDAPTLATLGKPLTEARVREAFDRALEINAHCTHLSVSTNLVIGSRLSEAHYRSLAALLGEAPATDGGRGAVYLSPLKDSPKKRELLPLVRDIQRASRLPVFIYLIQRL